MTSFDSLSPEEFVTAAFIIGITIASDKNADDNNVVGTFIAMVGDIIQTFAAQQQSTNNSNNNDNNSDNSSIKDLEERVKKLEEKLK